MAFGLYKHGQGRWSRAIGAFGLAALGVWGALQTYGWMVMADLNLTTRASWYIGYIVPGVILLAFLFAAYYVANRPKMTDFLIETETEMKKVTWPTSREVLSATVVVIVVVVILGAYLFAVDRAVIEPIFRLIGIYG